MVKTDGKQLPTNETPRGKPVARLVEPANGLVNDIYEDKSTGKTYAHRHDGGQTEKILEFNKKIRSLGATDSREMAQVPLSIPPDHYYNVLPITHPELFVKDQKLRTLAWKQFTNHPDCKPYLLQDKKTKYFNGASNELRPAKNTH